MECLGSWAEVEVNLYSDTPQYNKRIKTRRALSLKKEKKRHESKMKKEKIKNQGSWRLWVECFWVSGCNSMGLSPDTSTTYHPRIPAQGHSPAH